MTWHRVCQLDDLPVLGSRVIERNATEGGNIAVFRTQTDRVFALRDRCPHRGGPLSQGIVFGESVACPLHNWTIALSSGAALAPDEGHAACYAVRVDAGTVYVNLDTASPASTVGRVQFSTLA
jgi:nitrite reductase (NADH) small subunit